MAIVSVGYDGPVTEAQWAALAPAIGSGSKYGVSSSVDWKVTAHPSTAQAVIVNAGSGWGPGVFDTSDASVTVQCDAIPSGTRYDLIVAHRNWAGTGGVTTFAKVNGTSSKAIPGSRVTNPGTVDDQPLALVKWTAGQTQPTEIVDLRCWAGSGGLYVADTLALTYLQQLGAQVRMKGGKLWTCDDNGAGGNAWVPYQMGAAKGYGRTTGYYEPGNSGSLGPTQSFTICSISIPDPGFPYHIQASAVVEAGGGGAGTRWDVVLTVNGGWLSAARGDAVAPWFDLTGNTVGAPRTGPTTVALIAIKQFGGGAFGLSAYNQFFSALIVPAM